MRIRKPEINLTAIAGILFLVTLTIISGGLRALSAPNQPTAAAIVNGQTISARLVSMYLKNDIEALEIDPKSDAGRKKIETLQEGIIDELINRQLIQAEAIRRHLQIDQNVLDEEYNRSIDEMGGQEKYRQYLASAGVSDDDFRSSLCQQQYCRLVKDALDKEVTASDSEIEDFYQKQKSSPVYASIFNNEEQVRASHILIDARPNLIASQLEQVGKLSPGDLKSRVGAEMNRRRRLAESILNRLKNGADFSQLARESSDDAATKNNGGDLGWFGRNSHTSAFDTAAFDLKSGELSGVVQTEYGFHIIKVTDHIYQHLRSLQEASPAILARLLRQKRAAHLADWIDLQRRNASILVDPAYKKGQLQRFEAIR